MTTPHGFRDDLDTDDGSGSPEAFDEAAPDRALRSFAVIARFRRVADSAKRAEALVREDLRAVRDQYDDAKVEPQEPDGRWAVDVRFVVASLDGETALQGVDGTLREVGASPDETWVAQELA